MRIIGYHNRYTYFNPTKDDSKVDFVLNFPSNWLQLDVARDNITGYTDLVRDDKTGLLSRNIRNNIAEALYNQVSQFINLHSFVETSVPAICVQEIVEFTLALCGKGIPETLQQKINALKYKIKMTFNDSGVIYQLVSGDCSSKRLLLEYASDEVKKQRMYLIETKTKIDAFSIYEGDIVSNKILYDKIYHSFMKNKHKMFVNYKIPYDHTVLKNQSKEKHYKYLLNYYTQCFRIIPDDILQAPNDDFERIVYKFENVLLEYLKVGKNPELKIFYDDFNIDFDL